MRLRLRFGLAWLSMGMTKLCIQSPFTFSLSVTVSPFAEMRGMDPVKGSPTSQARLTALFCDGAMENVPTVAFQFEIGECDIKRAGPPANADGFETVRVVHVNRAFDLAR